MAWSRACAATISRWMPANSRLLSARLRPRVPRSAMVSGLAIRMTSVLCSSPAAPMLTSLTIQATLPLPQREYRPENTSSGLAPPISRQSPRSRPQRDPLLARLASARFARHAGLCHDGGHPPPGQHARAPKKQPADDPQEPVLIRWSGQEIRRVVTRLARRQIEPAAVIAWSLWRRAHQAAAQEAHIKLKTQL